MSEAARPVDEQIDVARPDIDTQILTGTRQGQKDYGFDEQHNPHRPAEVWFQESHEGEILFVVFYTQACRWSRCLGCNLPSRMSSHHVSFKSLMSQIDFLFADPAVVQRYETLRKVIVSNNGSVLDEQTFSSTALMYLIAKLNLHLPRLKVLSLETRAEYVDKGEYYPPRLRDVARAALAGEGQDVSIFLGLSDEGLACEGGSFLMPGEESLVEQLECFNRTQDYELLRREVLGTRPLP